MYENGNIKLFTETKDAEDCVKQTKSYYTNLGTPFEEKAKAYSIRIYFVEINERIKNNINCEIISVLHNAKTQNIKTAVVWQFKSEYKDKKIQIRLTDKMDILYAIWDVFEKIMGQENTKTIKELKFNFVVTPKVSTDGYTSKQRLTLFFSKEGNWGKLWKYTDLRIAMAKAGLAMEGRGIEGERPREFRYQLGYPFITNETDKNIKDGHCIVHFPFPTLPRNERRNPNMNLDKDDWSDLLEILKREPKKLRCYECGLFEEEKNKVGQSTKFQKSHLESFLTGSSGDASKENIVAICQYCNSKQKNLFNYDKHTGKKLYNCVEFMKVRDHNTKLEVLTFLIKTLKKEDIKKIIDENKIKI